MSKYADAILKGFGISIAVVFATVTSSFLFKYYGRVKGENGCIGSKDLFNFGKSKRMHLGEPANWCFIQKSVSSIQKNVILDCRDAASIHIIVLKHWYGIRRKIYVPHIAIIKS